MVELRACFFVVAEVWAGAAVAEGVVGWAMSISEGGCEVEGV
jgi:hypothetical protein